MKNNTRPRLPRHLLVSILLACVAVFASTATASATVYCVHDPECPAGGIEKDAFGEAIAAANQDVAADIVRVGPGTFPSPPVSVSTQVDVVGAGMNATKLEDTGNNGIFLYLSDGDSKVSDLTVRLTADDQEGMRLMNGAAVHGVKVEAPHALSSINGIMAEGASEISSVVVDIGPGLQGYAIGDIGDGSIIEDATLTAGIGLVPSDPGTIARRVTIHANQALWVLGGVLNLANALITPYPDTPQSPTFTAADVKGDNEGVSALLNLADATIIGPGLGHGGLGIVVRSNTGASTGTATANIQGVVIDGVQTSFSRNGKSATQTADLTISHSAYDAQKVSNGSGNGSLTVGAGNLTGGADPKFVDPAASDFRLRFDSPLLDVGPPVEPLSSDDPDLGGRPRVRDSDGNGSAVRDIGAYEYQRLAPSAAFTLAPATAAVGEGVGFEATGDGDPDGDPATYSWDFGDGAGGSGTSASHAYATAGSYSPSLTVTDASGLSATTSRIASVLSPSPILTNLSESARRWVVGGPAASMARRAGKPAGTTFRFELNVPAHVRVAFSRKVVGRRVSGRCARKTRHNAQRVRCVRKVAAGALELEGRAGPNKLRFTGRIPGAGSLRPGAYRATFTALDTLGRRSAPRSLSFRILRR